MSPPAPPVSRLCGFGVVAGAHGGDFGGGHMPAPGFAMRVGGAEGMVSSRLVLPSGHVHMPRGGTKS